MISLSSANNYELKKAKEVFYLDEPRFDSIKNKLLELRCNLFPVELGGENRLKKAKDLFGMSLVSELITEEVLRGDEIQETTKKWKLKFERIKPVLLARLNKDRPESQTRDQSFFKSLRLYVVKSIEKKYRLFDTGDFLFGEEAVSCWFDNDNILFLNSSMGERSLWSGIAEALAQKLGQTYYEAFENLLLCESDSERIEKLRRAGVPEGDVHYCQQVLKDESLPIFPERDNLKTEIKVERHHEQKSVDKETFEIKKVQILKVHDGEFDEESQYELNVDIKEIEEKIDNDEFVIDKKPPKGREPTYDEVSQETKDEVEITAMDWVEYFEKDNRRAPKNVSHYNLGYDFKSVDPSTGEIRYIKDQWVKVKKGRLL